jgi:hypothetical protein
MALTQVERMNRTIKEATVQRYPYDDHHQLRHHLEQFVSAYSFARRLKMLKGLTPYEAVCRAWQDEPDRFDNYEQVAVVASVSHLARS